MHNLIFYYDIIFVCLSLKAEEAEIETIISDIFEKVNSVLNCYILLTDYIAADDDIITTLILSDTDIIEVIRPPIEDFFEEANVEDQVEDDIVDVSTTKEVIMMIKGLRRYLYVNSNGEMSQSIDDLERFIETNIITDVVQTKITDFFKKN